MLKLKRILAVLVMTFGSGPVLNALDLDTGKAVAGINGNKNGHDGDGGGDGEGGGNHGLGDKGNHKGHLK
jgi:hypothetical protein